MRVTEEVHRRINEMSGQKCLGCEREFDADERTVRGCCLACYAAINRAIRSGRVTEKDMMKEGRILAAGPGGRKPVNPMSKELAGLKK